MANSYLGKVSPAMLKRLKKLRPQAPRRVSNTEVSPIRSQSEFAIDQPNVHIPEWLTCGMAAPHTDWGSYFLTVSVLGRREFGEYNGDGMEQTMYLTIDPGDVFVVDGSKLHWLYGADYCIPRGWWMGLQWELDPDRVDCPQAVDKILNLLEVDRTRAHKGSLDERYRSWM